MPSNICVKPNRRYCFLPTEQCFFYWSSTDDKWWPAWMEDSQVFHNMDRNLSLSSVREPSQLQTQPTNWPPDTLIGTRHHGTVSVQNTACAQTKKKQVNSAHKDTLRSSHLFSISADLTWRIYCQSCLRARNSPLSCTLTSLCDTEDWLSDLFAQ